MVYRIAFFGLQKGDEGKGVRVAYYVKKSTSLSQKVFDDDPRTLNLRWQGGKNAGHTLEIEGTKYVLHQVPSGILVPNTYNLMSEGVFLEPRACLKEIEDLRQRGVVIDSNNFGIASNAHVTLDDHLERDVEASASVDGRHTSTGSGNAPTAMDKYGRVGVRFQEFLTREGFVNALRDKFNHGIDNRVVDRLVDSYEAEMEGLKEFSVLQSQVLADPEFRFAIAEGAQGFYLDVDRGLYPGITSSNASTIPLKVDKRVGVVKAYESSVGGNRPFVGRMSEDLEKKLRTPWREFGSTTGKPRDLGWFDVVALKHAIESSEVDCLVSTCGDRISELAKLGEKVRLVTGYKIDGRTFNEWDKTFHDRRTLYGAEPVVEEFEPWTDFFDKKEEELDPKAQKFFDRIESLTGTEFVAHGYGPGIDDVFELKDILTE